MYGGAEIMVEKTNAYNSRYIKSDMDQLYVQTFLWIGLSRKKALLAWKQQQM